MDPTTVAGRDPRTFLSAMLEREEAEKGEPRDIKAFPIDPEDRALFSKLFHGKKK
jgi:hypothetical protein